MFALVTGVQTCALPICRHHPEQQESRRRMTVPFTTIDKLYINGEWIDSGPEREDVINPATETVIGRAPVGTAAAADAAIAAARTAFDDGPWPTMSMAEGAAILRRLHAALDARRADIAALIVAEVEIG